MVKTVSEWNNIQYIAARNNTLIAVNAKGTVIGAGDITMKVYGNGDWGEEMPLLRDQTNAGNSNKYLTFISGDNAMSVITNESLPEGTSCVLVKGSFGNCFAPYLTQNYHTVYVLDYRKYYRYTISEFVEVYDVDDVIVLPYLMATQGAEGTDLFKYLLS